MFALISSCFLPLPKTGIRWICCHFELDKAVTEDIEDLYTTNTNQDLEKIIFLSCDQWIKLLNVENSVNKTNAFDGCLHICTAIVVTPAGMDYYDKVKGIVINYEHSAKENWN